MSTRSLHFPASLVPLGRRLRARPHLALLLLAGFAAATVVGAWLWPSAQVPGTVEVALPLPPPPATPTQRGADAGVVSAPGDSEAAAFDPAAARPGRGNAVTVPPVPAGAFSQVPPAPRAAPLPPAPDAALVETTAEGALPRRGADGRLPWHAYARPFPAGDGRARIAIVVSGLGSSAAVTGEIIRRLPADVTLAFEPGAAGADRWAADARAAGHEIMLSLPVQGGGFPFLDRGPEALAGDSPAAENRARLHRLLTRLAGYVGVLASVGAETDLANDALATGALQVAEGELARRGLLLVTPRPGTDRPGDPPQLGVNLTIGPDADAAASRSRLAELEGQAAAKGYALAVIEPTPAAVAAVAAWAGTLTGKPMAQAPVSAVAQAVQARGR